MKRKHDYVQKSIVTFIVGWLVVFVFLPNLLIVAISFLTRDETQLIRPVLTLDNYARLADPLYAGVLLHSLNMALMTTFICLLIGYPFAWCLTRLPPGRRPLMVFLLIVPFWTNSLIRIYGLKLFLATRGWLNQLLLSFGFIEKPLHILYTPQAVVISLVSILLPFMVLPLYSSLQKLDKTCLESARDLGASAQQTFIRIILPLTMPGIVSGCLLVLLPAMSMFYVADLMGGARNLLIGNIIKNQFLTLRDWPLGAATSIVLTLIMGFLLLIYRHVTGVLNKKGEPR